MAGHSASADGSVHAMMDNRDPVTAGERAGSTCRGNMTIAAIIPLYNGERWIAGALRSIFVQTHSPDEIIVVDDGSTDRGPGIVKEISRKHPVRLLSKPNGGQSSARNFGIAHCESRLVALLDQDDLWYQNHLEELERAFREYPGPGRLGWVYSNLDRIDEKGAVVCRSFLDALPARHPKQDLRACIGQDMYVLPSASMIDVEAIRRVGGFDERLSGYEDDDLFIRLLHAGYQNIYIEKPLSQWRIYPFSTSYTPRMARSRMVYAEKLFHDHAGSSQAVRCRDWDLIARRFMRNVLGDVRMGLQRPDREMYETGIADLKELASHLAVWRRIPWRVVSVLASRYRLARMVHRIAWLLLPRCIPSACRHIMGAWRRRFF